MLVRRYQAEDAQAIARLFRETIQKINSQDYSPEQIAAWVGKHEDLAAWRARLAVKNPFVAIQESQVVGFAELESDGHIDCFYVHHACQGQGVGTALMHAIEQAAQQADLKRLYAEVSITARPFFAARGFVILRHQMVSVGGVALPNSVMERSLETSSQETP